MNNEKTYQDSQTWESVLKLINSKYINYEELILKKDEPITVLFRGEPFCYEAVWQGPKWILYDPNYPPHQNITPALRILINVAVIDEDVLFSKYFDMDVTTFKDLVKLREKYGLGNRSYILTNIDDDSIEQCIDIELGDQIDNDLKNKIDCLLMICLSSVIQKNNIQQNSTTMEITLNNISPNVNNDDFSNCPNYPCYWPKHQNSSVSPYDLSAVAKYKNSSKDLNVTFEKPWTTDSPYDLSAVVKYNKRKNK